MNFLLTSYNLFLKSKKAFLLKKNDLTNYLLTCFNSFVKGCIKIQKLADSESEEDEAIERDQLFNQKK